MAGCRAVAAAGRVVVHVDFPRLDSVRQTLAYISFLARNSTACAPALRHERLRIEDLREELVVPARDNLAQRPSRHRSSLVNLLTCSSVPDALPCRIVVPPVSAIPPTVPMRSIRLDHSLVYPRRSLRNCLVDKRLEVPQEHAVREVGTDDVESDGGREEGAGVEEEEERKGRVCVQNSGSAQLQPLSIEKGDYARASRRTHRE